MEESGEQMVWAAGSDVLTHHHPDVNIKGCI
jgi:hypothetical protein